MGGYGALRLGAKYADRFKGVSAHSSLTHPLQLARFVEEPLDAYLGGHEEELNVLFWMKKNKEKLPPIRFDCGTSDDLIEENRTLHRNLIAHGIPHHYFEFEGGHSWEHWREHVRDTFLFFNNRCMNSPS
jgi:S-formylglutathione hydrolase FrmB